MRNWNQVYGIIHSSQDVAMYYGKHSYGMHACNLLSSH